jgi:hypothetical protein
LILLRHERKRAGDHQDQPNPNSPLQQIYFFHGELLVCLFTTFVVTPLGVKSLAEHKSWLLIEAFPKCHAPDA